MPRTLCSSLCLEAVKEGTGGGRVLTAEQVAWQGRRPLQTTWLNWSTWPLSWGWRWEILCPLTRSWNLWRAGVAHQSRQCISRCSWGPAAPGPLPALLLHSLWLGMGRQSRSSAGLPHPPLSSCTHESQHTELPVPAPRQQSKMVKPQGVYTGPMVTHGLPAQEGPGGPALAPSHLNSTLPPPPGRLPAPPRGAGSTCPGPFLPQQPRPPLRLAELNISLAVSTSSPEPAPRVLWTSSPRTPPYQTSRPLVPGLGGQAAVWAGLPACPEPCCPAPCMAPF